MLYYWLRNFFIRKKENVVKTAAHNIFGFRDGKPKKETFLSKGSAFGKFVTYTRWLFFFFLSSLPCFRSELLNLQSRVVQRSFCYWSPPARRSCDFLFFSNDYRYRTPTQLDASSISSFARIVVVFASRTCDSKVSLLQATYYCSSGKQYFQSR